MFIIYDLIFLIIVIIYFPFYLLKGKFHRGFSSRFGCLPKDLNLDRPIWVHAVSVGEVMAVKSLIEGLRLAYPAKRLVISTVTTTGNKIARDIAGKDDLVTYLPLDFSFVVNKYIKAIKPSLAVIVETELWPNLITCLYAQHIPVMVVNARISDASFKGYLTVKFFIMGILNKVNVFCAQTERDAQRLIRLGVLPQKVKTTGNMKFDSLTVLDVKQDEAQYRKRLYLNTGEKLLVAGSTHPGEEGIVLSVYQELLRDFSGLRLLIAPRHPERSREISRLINKFGFQAVTLSTSKQPLDTKRQTPVFVLDTVGELASFYRISDIVFVGGSLVEKGGHNILEPALFAKPIISGPYIFNFKDMFDLFLKRSACILVRDKEELKTVIRNLLKNPDQMFQLGKRAKELIAENRGASERNLVQIKEYVKVP